LKRRYKILTLAPTNKMKCRYQSPGT